MLHMMESVAANQDRAESSRRLQVLARFYARGETVRGWAKRHQLSPWIVYKVLQGRLACRRGEAHRAAVLLGLKNGLRDDAD